MGVMLSCAPQSRTRVPFPLSVYGVTHSSPSSPPAAIIPSCPYGRRRRPVLFTKDACAMATELPKQYDPREAQERWLRFWNDHRYFHSEPDSRTPYTIVIPPPN